MYTLGVDLGTTFTAAATWRDGRAEIAPLGPRGATIPSVVLVREDGTFLIGDAANRRALAEPQRVAREFKRRLGDPTPIMLAGAPYSAEALMGRLLQQVVAEVRAREGGAPAAVCVCHPANWGPYKTDLLRQAVRMADLDQPVSFTTEPEAAAVSYAQKERLAAGAIVAVYDLGGGTFDAAVLRKTQSGFAILGRPEGIERLGGMDFDAAVFDHVARTLGGKLAELDEDDPSVVAAVGRLREECVEAKESLSADTDVAIPVLLPNVTSEVRLTRAELEAMVRPALSASIAALRRSLESAGVTDGDLHSVLLVGGSSRMPVVAQMVGAELGRPVAVDAHPKYAVAMGAAWVASGAAGGAREVKAAGVRGSATDPPSAVTRPSVSSPARPAPAVPQPVRPSGPPPAARGSSARAQSTQAAAEAPTARPTSGPSPSASAPPGWSGGPPRASAPDPPYWATQVQPRPRYVAAALVGVLIGLLAGLVVLLVLGA